MKFSILLFFLLVIVVYGVVLLFPIPIYAQFLTKPISDTSKSSIQALTKDFIYPKAYLYTYQTIKRFCSDKLRSIAPDINNKDIYPPGIDYWGEYVCDSDNSNGHVSNQPVPIPPEPNPGFVDEKTVGFFLIAEESDLSAIEKWYIEKMESYGWKLSSKTIIKTSEQDELYCGGTPALTFVPAKRESSNNEVDMRFEIQAPCRFSDPGSGKSYPREPIVGYIIRIFTPFTGIENFSGLVEPLPSPSPINTCTLSGPEEQKRQEIFNYLNTKYKFKVADTNVCGQLSDCGNNPPWPSEDLNKVKNLLDSLPACFVNNLNLNQISGVQWSPAVDNNWDPNSLGQRISKNICCSQEAKNDCSVAHYWGQGYNNITVCGDMYKNGVDDQGRACKQFFSLEGILAHEMTHALQFNALGVVIQPQIYGTVQMISWMNKTGWTTNWKAGTFCLLFLGCNFVPPADLPSNYAKSSNDPAEDMAESVRLYYENPELLKQISQRRYDFVKNNIMCGKEFTK